MLTWYAVQTNPQCERRAETGLREHGFTVFCPVETHWKRSKTKERERVNKPLFTGYLFVGVAPWQSLYHVRQIDGVKGMVCGTNGEPINVGYLPIQLPTGRFLRNPDGSLAKVHFVYDLQARQAAGEFDHTPARRSQFRKGDKARVVLDGPLKDAVAEILSASDDGRVKLLLSAKFGWTTMIDSDQLEPVEEVAKAA